MLNRECRLLSSRFASILVVFCIAFLANACGHSTEAFLTKGEEYLQKRKFHDAMMQFRSAAEADSGSAGAHWGLARSYENLGRFNEVLDELRKTVEIDNSNLEAKAKLGNYFLVLQPPMIAETEKLRNEILEVDPNFIEAHLLTAAIMAAQGKPDSEVVNAVKKAIAMEPTRVQSYISLERLYMTRENPTEAEAAIKSGIAANPSSPLGYIEYGRFLMYASRDAESEEQFKKAISVGPEDIEAREAIADFYVTSRQLDKAEAAYLELTRIQENSPESRLDLAEFYSSTQRGDLAIETLQQIITEVPEYVRARYKLGEIYLDRKDHAKVEEQLAALFEINDRDVTALTLRAKMSLRENDGEQASKDLDEVLKRSPSEREALFLMAQARLSLGQIDMANAYIADLEKYHPTYIRSGLLRIQSAFTKGDAEGVIKLANEMLAQTNKATPNADLEPQAIHDLRIRAVSSRGLANIDLGKIAEAKIDLGDALKMAPKSASAMVNLAKAFTAGGDNAEAMKLYGDALIVEPQNFDAASGSINAAIRLKQTDKAHATVERLLNANTGKGDVQAALHYLRSTVFSAEKDPSSAESELKRSIEIDPDYMPAYTAYASLMSGQGRADEAVELYSKVIAKRPSAQIYTLLGILEDARSNMSVAEENYRKALELAPESPIAANNLAWLLVDKQGNLDEALQLATLAVNKSPNVAGYYDTLGWVYLNKGLALPAVEQLRKAVSIEDTNARRSGAIPNASYRVRLGMALAKAGDKASAKREVETSLRSAGDMSQRDIQDAKGLLATL